MRSETGPAGGTVVAVSGDAITRLIRSVIHVPEEALSYLLR
jgi:hypothetical protein